MRSVVSRGRVHGFCGKDIPGHGGGLGAQEAWQEPRLRVPVQVHVLVHAAEEGPRVLLLQLLQGKGARVPGVEGAGTGAGAGEGEAQETQAPQAQAQGAQAQGAQAQGAQAQGAEAPGGRGAGGTRRGHRHRRHRHRSNT